MTDASKPSQVGLDRSVFMARIHAALGHATTETPASQPPVVDESLARLASAQDDLIDLFATQAQAAGMLVHRFKVQDMFEKIVALLRELKAERVVTSLHRQGSPGWSAALHNALDQAGIAFTDGGGPTVDQFDLDAGITDVHAALAETGTIVCCSDSSHSRGASLIPPAHLAIVPASDILPDMIDYWARLEAVPAADLPSSQSFITGPSKTSDIEGTLVTGVHGPGIVHVLLVEDA